MYITLSNPFVTVERFDDSLRGISLCTTVSINVFFNVTRLQTKSANAHCVLATVKSVLSCVLRGRLRAQRVHWALLHLAADHLIQDPDPNNHQASQTYDAG